MYWPQLDITTTPVTVQVTDRVFWVDATSQNIVLNLPSVVNKAALYFIFKKEDSSSHTVTINPPSGKTIDGLSTYVLTNQYQIIGVTSKTDGNYRLVDGNASGAAVGQGRSFIEKTDGNVSLGATAAVSGMTQALTLDTAGNVIITVSGAFSLSTVASATIGIEVDGVQYTWDVINDEVGSGDDYLVQIAGSHTMGIFLNSGAHTIKFLAGGSGAGLYANSSNPASLVIQYPTVVTFGGGSPTSDPTNDLDGTWENPIVVGIQDDDLPTKIANGYLRRNRNNTGWLYDPTLITVYRDHTNKIGPYNTLDFVDATNITWHVSEDITNSKIILFPEATGGTSSADPLGKTFFTHNNYLPANTHREDLYDFPTSFDFSNLNGGTRTLSFSRAKFVPTGANLVANFGFDMGALRSKVLIILNGWRCSSAFGNSGLFFSDAVPSAAELPDNSYLAYGDANGHSIYKKTGGSFTSLVGPDATFGLPSTIGGTTISYAFYYDDATGLLSQFARYGQEQWILVNTITDSSLTTVRYAGFRLNTSSGNAAQYLIVGLGVYYE